MDEMDIVVYIIAKNSYLKRIMKGILVLVNSYVKVQKYYEECMLKNRTFVNNETRLSILDGYIQNGDIEYVNQVQIDRMTFGLLCELLLVNGRLKNNRLITIKK